MTASFQDLLTLLGPLGPLICPFVIISCEDTSRLMCMSMPRTLDGLKEAIRVEVAQIDRAMLERVEANFQE